MTKKHIKIILVVALCFCAGLISAGCTYTGTPTTDNDVKIQTTAIITYGIDKTITINVVNYTRISSGWIAIQADNRKIYSTNEKNVLIIKEKIK